MPFARKKGFTVPVGDWILAKGGDLAGLVARQPGVAEACHPAAVERLFREGGPKQGKAAWTLLVYALWHHIHIEGNGPKATVEETLAA